MSRIEKKPGKKNLSKHDVAQRHQNLANELEYGTTQAPLFKIVSLAPLISGVVVSSYTPDAKLSLFYLIFLIFIVVTYIAYLVKKQGRIAIADLKTGTLYVAGLVLTALFYTESQSATGTALVVCAALLGILSEGLVLDRWFRIVIAGVSLAMQMGVLAVLGIFSQTGDFFLTTSVLGIAPGLTLAAAYVVERSRALEDQGWTRTIYVSHKTKGTIARPGRITQLFSIFFILGPALCVLLAPSGILPPVFALAGLLLLLQPKTILAFSMRTSTDQRIISDVTKTSAWFSILLLAMGVYARA